MSNDRVQTLRELREEMKAVARGDKTAKPDANKPTCNSVEAIVRLLTPANRRLLVGGKGPGDIRSGSYRRQTHHFYFKIRPLWRFRDI